MSAEFKSDNYNRVIQRISIKGQTPSDQFEIRYTVIDEMQRLSAYTRSRVD